MSGAQHSLPDDAEGREVREQFSALHIHRREDIYSVSGNHDRSGLAEPEACWWQKWVDLLDEHTEFSGVDPAARRYAVERTWERYSFRVGNLLFLIMSDRNEPTQSIGRGVLCLFMTNALAQVKALCNEGNARLGKLFLSKQASVDIGKSIVGVFFTDKT